MALQGVKLAFSSLIDPALRATLVDLADQSGATTASSPSDKPTHFVCSHPAQWTRDGGALDHLNSSDDGVLGMTALVTPVWVTRSIDAGKAQPTIYYSPDPAMTFSGLVICASELPPTDRLGIEAAVRELGGQFQRELTAQCTHLIVLAPSGTKYEHAVTVGPSYGIKVVLPHWFERSFQYRRTIPTGPYRFPNPPFFRSNGWTNPSAPFEQLAAEGSLASGTGGAGAGAGESQSQGPPPNSTVTFEVFGDLDDAQEKEGEAYKTSVVKSLGHASPPPSPSKSRKSRLTSGANAGDGDGERAKYLRGKRIYLSSDLGLSQGLEQAVVVQLHEAGADNVWSWSLEDAGSGSRKPGAVANEEDTWAKRVRAEQQLREADVVVCSRRMGWEYWQAYDQEKTIASVMWLYHGFATDRLTDPFDHLFHYPTPGKPIEGISGADMTITNYVGTSREYVRAMIEHLGGKHTGSMTKSTKIVIASTETGQKIKHARQWSIPVLPHVWLEACWLEWKFLDPNGWLANRKQATGGVEGADYATLLGSTKVLKGSIESWIEREEVKAEREQALNSFRVGAGSQLDRERIANLTSSSNAPMPTNTASTQAPAPPLVLPLQQSSRTNGGSSPAVVAEEQQERRERKSSSKAPPSVGAASKSKKAPEPEPEEEEEEDAAMDLGGGEEEAEREREAAEAREREKEEEEKARLARVKKEAKQKAIEAAAEKTRKKEEAKKQAEEARRAAEEAQREADEAYEEAQSEQREISAVETQLFDLTKHSTSKGKGKAKASIQEEDEDEEDEDEEIDVEPAAETTSKPISDNKSSKSKKSSTGSKKLSASAPASTSSPATGGIVIVEVPRRRSSNTNATSNANATPAGPMAPMISSDALAPPESIGGGGRAGRAAKSKAFDSLHGQMVDKIKYEQERRRYSGSGKKRKLAPLEHEKDADVLQRHSAAVDSDSDDEDEEEDEEQDRGEGPSTKKQRTDNSSPVNGRKGPVAAIKSSAAAKLASATTGALSSFDNPPNPKAVEKQKAKKAKTEASKPKVRWLATGILLEDSIIEGMEALGAAKVTKPAEVTHLVVKSIARTENFLSCLPYAPFIVTERWLKACVKEKKLLDPEPYYLVDKTKEAEYEMNLKTSLERAEKGKVFAGYVFHITKGCTPDLKTLRPIIQANGGAVLESQPKRSQLIADDGDKQYVVISTTPERRTWEKARWTNEAPRVPIFSVELILSSVLRQEVDLKRKNHRVDLVLESDEQDGQSE